MSTPSPESISPPPGITRSVQPELLDRIPMDAPEARASRRDLRVINHLLGYTRWFRREWREHHRTGERVLEIGAGGGQLAPAFNAITPKFAGLDLGPRPPDWPHQARWFETDVMDFDRWSRYQPTMYHGKVIIGDNLWMSVGSTNFDDVAGTVRQQL